MNSSTTPSSTVAVNSQRWIVSPAFDLLFFANIWWILGLVPSFVSLRGDTPLEFWQVYFLTTPHRWITLVLVSADPDRRRGRTWLFLLLAGLAGCVVLGTRGITGAFTCLMLVDYVWNAWHFASQHAGITRIYARKAGGGRPKLETTILRIFVTYVCLRLAGWTTGWSEQFPEATTVIRLLDLLILALPICLFAIDLFSNPVTHVAKLVYLGSVVSIYGSQLMAVRESQHRLIAGLVVASAAYHAVEYLAIVTFYAWRRRDQGSMSPFRTMASYWTQLLAVYVLCLGMLDYWASHSRFRTVWTGINIWVAYLHYAYDGMIWKLRRPETAKALDAQLKTEN